ncbi:MAG: TonB-dependent receptor, partial [Pseudomonadota bacterium]
AGLAPNGAGSLIKINGRPRWRANASILWSNEQWSAGVFANWIDDVIDNSVSADGDTADPGRLLPVDDYLTINVHVDYQFDTNFAESTRVRLGIRNLFDEEPPVADEAFGYFGSLHSNRGRYLYMDFRVKL